MSFALAHTIIGYIANFLSVVAFFMRFPIRLRQVAIAANICFVIFGESAHIWGMVISNAILIPLNLWRLRQLFETRDAVRSAMATTELSWDWIRPFMTRRRFSAGSTIFHKGDEADDIYFILDGTVRFTEIGVEIGIGTLFGEIAVFSPDRRRTSTAVALSDVALLTITSNELIELYEKNPQFGVYLMRLMTRRLIEDIERAAHAPANDGATMAETVDATNGERIAVTPLTLAPLEVPDASRSDAPGAAAPDR